jgi:hypothetical protein
LLGSVTVFLVQIEARQATTVALLEIADGRAPEKEQAPNQQGRSRTGRVEQGKHLSRLGTPLELLAEGPWLWSAVILAALAFVFAVPCSCFAFLPALAGEK